MDRELHFEYFEEKDKRENKIWLAVCRYLIWIGLIGVSLFFASRALIAQGKENVSGDITYLDQSYLAALSKCEEGERKELLQEYFQNWQQFLSDYLSQYEKACLYETDKEMIREYREAVEAAVASQQEFMTALGVSPEEVFWYGIQIYRTAFFGDLQGAVNKEAAVLYDVDTKENKNTSLTWCNELNTITMEAYEKLTQEDKELLTQWQICREEWKEAGNERMRHSPYELNSHKKDYSFGEEEKIEERLAVYSQINQLYYQQLICILS